MKQQTTIKLQTGFLTVIMVLVFTFSALSCKPEPEPICECTDKEHLGVGEKCCNGTDCDCTLKVYGYITDNVLGSDGVWRDVSYPIYRKGNVLDMDTAVEKAKEAYASLNDAEKGALLDKFTGIYIIPGADRNRVCINENAPVSDRQYIVELGEERSAISMRNFLGNLASDIYGGYAQTQPPNNIKLAQATPTVTVTSPNKG